MFQAIRKHLSYSNAAATLALVFAVTGGAFAATSHTGGSPAKATASVGRTASFTAVAAKKSKKKSTSTRGPTGPKGATGATGAMGAAGPAGATGPAGTNGTNGTGTEGKEGHEGKEGKEGPEGTPGAIHPGETLPPGASEHGVWSFRGPGGQELLLPISFPIPLAAPLDEAHTIVVHEGEKPSVGGCNGGSEANPIAGPGYLCVYVSQVAEFESEGGTIGLPNSPTEPQPVLVAANEGKGLLGANPSGGLLRITNEGKPQNGYAEGRGVWVVTAP